MGDRFSRVFGEARGPTRLPSKGQPAERWPERDRRPTSVSAAVQRFAQRLLGLRPSEYDVRCLGQEQFGLDVSVATILASQAHPDALVFARADDGPADDCYLMVLWRSAHSEAIHRAGVFRLDCIFELL